MEAKILKKRKMLHIRTVFLVVVWVKEENEWGGFIGNNVCQVGSNFNSIGFNSMLRMHISKS